MTLKMILRMKRTELNLIQIRFEGNEDFLKMDMNEIRYLLFDSRDTRISHWVRRRQTEQSHHILRYIHVTSGHFRSQVYFWPFLLLEMVVLRMDQFRTSKKPPKRWSISSTKKLFDYRCFFDSFISIFKLGFGSKSSFCLHFHFHLFSIFIRFPLFYGNGHGFNMKSMGSNDMTVSILKKETRRVKVETVSGSGMRWEVSMEMILWMRRVMDSCRF